MRSARKGFELPVTKLNFRPSRLKSTARCGRRSPVLQSGEENAADVAVLISAVHQLDSLIHYRRMILATGIPDTEPDFHRDDGDDSDAGIEPIYRR